MSPSPVLSVLIANWNTRTLLQSLLRSLQAHPPSVSHEIIVVDNGSIDGSADMVRGEFPLIRLMSNERNRGYAAAHNQAAAIAQGEFLLLLGSDTAVLGRSVQSMVDYITSHLEVGAVTCRLLNPDHSVQQSCRRFPTLLDAVATYLSLHMMARRYNIADFDFYRTQEVEQPAATCLMIRRSIFGKIGLFDERLAILYNDVDLCHRLLSAGWKIVYLADAEVLHYGSQSTKRATPEVRLEMYRNVLVYYFRRFGTMALILLLPILAVRLAILNRGKCVGGLFSSHYLSS